MRFASLYEYSVLIHGMILNLSLFTCLLTLFFLIIHNWSLTILTGPIFLTVSAAIAQTYRPVTSYHTLSHEKRGSMKKRFRIFILPALGIRGKACFKNLFQINRRSFHILGIHVNPPVHFHCIAIPGQGYMIPEGHLRKPPLHSQHMLVCPISDS